MRKKSNIIRNGDGSYTLLTPDGQSLGTYSTKGEAEERARKATSPKKGNAMKEVRRAARQRKRAQTRTAMPFELVPNRINFAPSTASEARDLAIEWSNWVSKQSLPWGEMAEWESYFEGLAQQFPEIREEFEENAIIGKTASRKRAFKPAERDGWKAVDLEVDDDGYSVHLVNESLGYDGWFDLWEEGGELLGDWNQYIFYDNDSNHMSKKKVQEDANNFMEAFEVAEQTVLSHLGPTHTAGKTASRKRSASRRSGDMYMTKTDHETPDGAFIPAGSTVQYMDGDLFWYEPSDYRQPILEFDGSGVPMGFVGESEMFATASYKQAQEDAAAYDLVGKMVDFETGLLSDEETVMLFQYLVDTGMAWSLQGSYGRLAENLIMMGLVQPPQAPPAEEKTAARKMAQSPAESGGDKVWSVWVGGTEVNDHFLDEAAAKRLAEEYMDDGYDDVQLDNRGIGAEKTSARKRAHTRPVRRSRRKS